MIQAGGPAPGAHVSRSGGPRSLPRPEGGVQAAVRSEAARETDLHCHPRQAGCPRASDSAQRSWTGLSCYSSSPLPQGLHGERGEKGAQGEKVFPICFSQSVQLSIDSVCVHVCVRACVRPLAGEARCRGGISFPAF